MSQLTLKCEKFGLSRGLHDLLSSGDLVDVTLACQGQFIQAHKTVLAACSPHFRSIFKMNPWQHPIVFMHDLELAQLQALVDFMYNGEVTVEETDLPGFLKLADALKVSGLTPQEKESETRLANDVQSQMHMTHAPPPLPTPPPAKIARRTRDRDVSRRDPSPVAPPAAPTNVENNSQQSWAPLTNPKAEETMLTSDIKVEDEEIRDLPAPEQNPISNSTQDCQPEEAEEEGADDSRLDPDDNQEDNSWYEAGPSTSSQSSSQPSTSNEPTIQPGVSGVSSRGPRDSVDEITLSDSDEDEAELRGVNYMPIADVLDGAPSGSVPNTSSANKIACVICNRKFASLHYLRKHLVEIHNKSIDASNTTCLFCFEKFPYQELALQHTKINHPQYRYNCNFCESSFSTQQRVLLHELKNHGQNKQPFQCNMCQKGYSTQARMNKHNKRFHPNLLI